MIKTRILTQDVAKAMNAELVETVLAQSTQAKYTHMSVLNASRLMVLLQNFLRNSGHKNSVVKSRVIKLQGENCDQNFEKKFLQIISQERGGGDELETNVTDTIFD